MNLHGNTILITGAGSGIGLALAEEFAKIGNKVIVAARSADKLRVAESKGLMTVFCALGILSDVQRHQSGPSFLLAEPAHSAEKHVGEGARARSAVRANAAGRTLPGQ